MNRREKEGKRSEMDHKDHQGKTHFVVIIESHILIDHLHPGQLLTPDLI